MLAETLRPAPDSSTHPWIIDGTLIPVHDQSITGINKNYPRSINTQVIICAHRRRVITTDQCRPGNRNNVVAAPATVGHLPGDHEILGDGGYRGITSISSPRRDKAGRIIGDNTYRAHRKIRTRVEHAIARIKDWQILRQYRRRGHAINPSLQTVTGLWNLKSSKQIRVNS